MCVLYKLYETFDGVLTCCYRVHQTLDVNLQIDREEAHPIKACGLNRNHRVGFGVKNEGPSEGICFKWQVRARFGIALQGQLQRARRDWWPK